MVWYRESEFLPFDAPLEGPGEILDQMHGGPVGIDRRC